eukprot:GGOE01002361.1.p2 GENE.GGOE01002361.1~~GGOE01002361.1.p2  ORF type:complete len:160 (-),score=41.61 GGOE01002361.1:143-622(-)
MEQMFSRPFIKARPPWLVNPKTDRALELDIYNEMLQLAVEYDGEQHAKFTKFFHKEPEAFVAQQERDALKDVLCRLRGVTLIRVPSTVRYDDLEEYLKYRLVDAGRPPPPLSKGFLHTLQEWTRAAIVIICVVCIGWPDCPLLLQCLSWASKDGISVGD